MTGHAEPSRCYVRAIVSAYDRPGGFKTWTWEIRPRAGGAVLLRRSGGWDVYLVDVRGYGGSTRPPEMDKPATEGSPFADTSTAVKDVSAAVNYILQKRGVAKINLMGMVVGHRDHGHVHR